MQRIAIRRTVRLALCAGPVALAAGAQAQSGFRSSGNISSGGDFRYQPSKSATLFLHPYDFRGAAEGNGITPSSSQWTNGAIVVYDSKFFSADVDLPVGATITTLWCLLYDDDGSANFQAGGQSRMELKRRELFSAAEAEIGEVDLSTSGADTEVHVLSDAFVTQPLVQANYDYYVNLQLTHSGNAGDDFDLRFYGCGIDYLMNRVPTEFR